MVKTIGTVLLALLGLRGCTASFCYLYAELVDGRAPRVLSLPIPVQPLLTAELDNYDLLAVYRTSQDGYLVRRDAVHGLSELQRISNLNRIGEEGLIVSGPDRWWYATALQRGGVYGALFVSGERNEPPRTVFVEHARAGHSLFLPLHGDIPRGLLLSFDSDSTLEALEIDAGGLGRKWRLDAPPNHGYVSQSWSAERLPDGRIALVWLAGSMLHPTQVLLRILSDDGHIDQTRLQTGRYNNVHTAVSEAGQLAVVVGAFVDSGERIVQATVVDANSPADANWVRMSGNENTVFMPHVVATSQGFVVAWLNAEPEGTPRKIRARELNRGRAGLATAEIGRTRASPGGYSFFDLRSQSGEPTFYWEDEQRQLVVRRMPSSLSSFEFLKRLVSTCERVEAALDSLLGQFDSVPS